MNTTWRISEESPGCSGTALGNGEGRDAIVGNAAVAKCNRLFSATAVVNATSSASVGIGTTCTDPRTAKTYRARCPPRDPSPDPTPYSAPIAKYLPSALTSRLDGYQAVGISPR